MTMIKKPSAILLVEDDVAHMGLIKRAFRKARVVNDIVAVPDGQAALDYLFRRGEYADPAASPRPGLILLDLKLPKVDGLDVLRQIKEDPSLGLIPTVVLTTSDHDVDLQRAYEHGANSYVIKPVKIEDFQVKVGNLGLYWVLTNEPLKRDE